MKDNRKWLVLGLVLLAAFVLWTILIQHIDVQIAGPNKTEIGFAAFNIWFHQMTGVHMLIYTITDWLGLVPILICMCLGLLGLVQWIKRRSMLRVDPDILLLGVYYVVVIFCYLLFEMVPINYRPILIEGVLEASYPSSTTLLTLTIMPTAAYRLNLQIKNKAARRLIIYSIWAFTLFMVIARLISGVHWLSDIIGGILLSGALVSAYVAFN